MSLSFAGSFLTTEPATQQVSTLNSVLQDKLKENSRSTLTHFASQQVTELFLSHIKIMREKYLVHLIVMKIKWSKMGNDLVTVPGKWQVTKN